MTAADATPTPAELIAEARILTGDQTSSFIGQLADALEAVTTERDALAATIAQARGLLRDNDFEWAKQVDAILSKLPADALAAHDARMKAAALREFADAVRMPWQVFQGDAGQVIRVGDLLRDEADRIEREAGQ